jgi:ribosomal protein S18 acetylase RimI-like enzyme
MMIEFIHSVSQRQEWLMLNFVNTEKPAQIQENMIAYMRLFRDLPGITIEDGDTFWCVCHRGAPGDGILRARWQAQGVEEQIDQLFEQIGQLIAEIGWMVFPCDQPEDLGQRLEARGMQGTRGGNWLWADLSAIAPAPAVPDGFRIEQVRDDAAMAAWVGISEAGFGGDLPWFYDAYARHGYGPDAFSLHYIGYLGDTPVTSGTLLDAGGCASIYDVSTPVALRRQGFGGALTHFLMTEIKKRGYPDTWIWSSDLGKSLYQKLGYLEADFGMREHHWQKNG